jgi:hypothetical protein
MVGRDHRLRTGGRRSGNKYQTKRAIEDMASHGYSIAVRWNPRHLANAEQPGAFLRFGTCGAVKSKIRALAAGVEM